MSSEVEINPNPELFIPPQQPEDIQPESSIAVPTPSTSSGNEQIQELEIHDDEEEEDEEDDDGVKIVLNTDIVETGEQSSFSRSLKPQFFRPSASHSTFPQQNQGRSGGAPQQSPIVGQTPGQKSAFEIDIDHLEEKPWRKQGADITDYFNYGFNEDTWKGYCQKQVQLRLEQSMQGKIKVYQSVPDQHQDMPQELFSLSGDGKTPLGNRQQQRRPPIHMVRREPARPGPGLAANTNPEWNRPQAEFRRRQREQDDSVIQVLASGDDQNSNDAPGAPIDNQESPPREDLHTDSPRMGNAPFMPIPPVPPRFGMQLPRGPPPFDPRGPYPPPPPRRDDRPRYHREPYPDERFPPMDRDDRRRERDDYRYDERRRDEFPRRERSSRDDRGPKSPPLDLNERPSERSRTPSPPRRDYKRDDFPYHKRPHKDDRRDEDERMKRRR